MLSPLRGLRGESHRGDAHVLRLGEEAQRLVAAFSPDATFVFHNHPTRLGSRAEYEQVWADWEREGFRVQGCRSTDQHVQLLTNDVAVFTHDVETDVSFGGEPETSRERETIVFRRGEGGWLAVHEHLSPREREPGPS